MIGGPGKRCSQRAFLMEEAADLLEVITCNMETEDWRRVVRIAVSVAEVYRRAEQVDGPEGGRTVIHPSAEELETGQTVLYQDPRSGKTYPARVLETNALTGMVRVRYVERRPLRRRDGEYVVPIERTRDRETGVGSLFLSGPAS